jgi:hypothetical protein
LIFFFFTLHAMCSASLYDRKIAVVWKRLSFYNHYCFPTFPSRCSYSAICIMVIKCFGKLGSKIVFSSNYCHLWYIVVGFILAYRRDLWHRSISASVINHVVLVQYSITNTSTVQNIVVESKLRPQRKVSVLSKDAEFSDEEYA